MRYKKIRDIEKYEHESGQITSVVEHIEYPLYVMLNTPFPDAPYLGCPIYIFENSGITKLQEGELLILHYRNHSLAKITRCPDLH